MVSVTICNTNFQFKVFHLNKQGFDQLKMLLSQLSDGHVDIDYILLYEIFLNVSNAYRF